MEFVGYVRMSQDLLKGITYVCLLFAYKEESKKGADLGERGALNALTGQKYMLCIIGNYMT